MSKFTWNPLSVNQLSELLSNADFWWCLAGGYAIEMFVGKTIREHGDIDILVKRGDQLKIQEHLSDWEVFIAKKGKLTFWEKGKTLSPDVYDLWCRSDSNAAWQLQVMLIDTIDEKWIFKRNPSIQKYLDEIVRKSEKGMPYLFPEIQLLYKAKSKTIEKDQIDFNHVIPLLNEVQKNWLLEKLQVQFPKGHKWIKKLKRV